ncbi:hypothetical protein KCP69_05950 [Salmonella enterica subsp. enterica]|nr:hypothetical protein KCP69_05950 [Salmonella enterica subsp. enterica]
MTSAGVPDQGKSVALRALEVLWDFTAWITSPSCCCPGSGAVNAGRSPDFRRRQH